jgi:O-antigen/teichoic acid export membrane protein
MHTRIKKLATSYWSNDIAKASFYTMMLQGASKGCRLLLWILLARMFTIAQFAQFAFGMSVALICCRVIFLGGGPVLAREWGRSDLPDDERTTYILKVSNWYLWRGLLLTVVLLFGFWLFQVVVQKTPTINSVGLLAVALVLPFFIFQLINALYVAKRKVIVANLIQFIVNITLLLIALCCGLWWHQSFVFILQAQLLVFTFMIVGFLLIWQRKNILYSIKPSACIVSFVLLQLGGVLFSLVDIVVLKLLSTATLLAHYSVALQLNAIVAFGLAAINQNIISYIASDVKRLDKHQLQAKLSDYARIISAYTFIFFFGIVLLGYPILVLYGSAYTSAYWPLLLLSLGSLVSGLCGNVGMLLNMSGRERFNAKVFWGAFLFNIILSICLVKPFGAIGVAFSVAVATMLWNIVMLIEVRRSIGVNPTILSRRLFKKLEVCSD